MIYVDELRRYFQAPKPGSERWFGNGKESCHLTADTPEELHAFAQRLGLRRSCAQSSGYTLHYDLIPQKRARAVALGAREVTARERARMIAAQIEKDRPDVSGV